MRKITVSEFMSLDGVIEAPETWHFPYLSDDMQEVINEDIQASYAMLLGRLTYEAFAGYWPTQPGDGGGITDKLNSVPKYVVSKTLQKADWNNSTLIKDNVAEQISRLTGIVGVTGSATLVQWLMQNNLVDELRLMVHPIVVGKGRRLFKDGMPTSGLKLVESRTFKSGVILLIYQPANQ